jgi:AraC family transcriptional regulator, regulatory protein of adaptative response / methylated-DNA-[protein]-cysteine methyltransferase
MIRMTTRIETPPDGKNGPFDNALGAESEFPARSSVAAVVYDGRIGAMGTLPSADRMYRALAERDPSFEGIFFTGVRTTRIFCRPGCTARLPRRENCRFFATAAAALSAGFRPCLRCRPLGGGRPAPRAVEALLRRIDADPARRITDRDLAGLHLDPSTARRGFKKHCGMTFQAYQRARRMGLAFRDLRAGKRVAEAALGGGYASFSGFGAAFTKMFGAPPSGARRLSCLLADRIQTPLGPMVAVADDGALVLLEFHDRRALPREIAWIKDRFGAAIAPGSNAVLQQIARELGEYFAGRRVKFDTPLRLEGSAFQVAAWKGLLAIPSGATRSYAELAAAAGRPGASRAIGRANGENRLAIVVPCHRVIRSDGTLCGYGGGVWRKRWLLDHEAAIKA